MKRVSGNISKAVLGLETVLAVFIIFSVIIGSIDLISYVKNIYINSPPFTYDLFQSLLGHVLLLVIGLELSLMLIRHTPGSVIEVLLFAIARKILIYSTYTYEYLIGIAALAGIFAIRRFLFVPKISEIEGIILSAATPIKDVNRIIGSHIPEDIAKTLGGLVITLAEELKEELAAGKNLKIADVSLEIMSSKDGVIEKVRVEKLNSQS